MTETGSRRVIVRRVRAGLRVLRDDLCTLKVDPLPPSLWLRWLPHGVVCLAALGITLGGMAQLHDNGRLVYGTAFPIAVAQGGATVLALWRPVPAWWLSMAGSVVGALLLRAELGPDVAGRFVWPWTAAGIIAHLLVLLLLALRVPTRVSAEALVLTGLATWLVEGVWENSHYGSSSVLTLCLSAIVVVLGMALRGRREARAELGRQTTLTAEERARRTLLEERSRIARELHDVVAHHMSVISIQAQVAPHLVKDPPEELQENLAGIRQNALEALGELRRVLGVLRAEHPDRPDAPDESGGGAPHTPQPTLDRIDALVENTRAAGLAVTVRVVGERRPLPPGVELSAYRIVQEALSNTLRHAPGASASVLIAHHDHGLDVKIINSRPDQQVPPSPGAGHGLLGMRERVTMLGGVLTAGPRRGGGYEVIAHIPVPTPTDVPGHSDGSPLTSPTPDPTTRPPTDPKDDTA
ncbi:sensor histidine kinase [Streptomyces sp. YU58]|uniref:sensor histidine kinase n=1 Tax=Streptomyces sp. SX92 TaxID=3158972 RepID=UPI0027B93D3A|nr:sensor histidine kinase [Streptomyces coralus]WLW53353.1 sensor histidine kinase [Streptomyces coralus]